MAGRGLGHPDDRASVVDAIPEPTARRDLLLPLLQLDTVDRSPAKRPLQRVLPGVTMSGARRDPLPRRPTVGPGHRAHQVPALRSIVGREAEIPSALRRWRGNTLFALRHVRPAEERSCPRGEGRPTSDRPGCDRCALPPSPATRGAADRPRRTCRLRTPP